MNQLTGGAFQFLDGTSINGGTSLAGIGGHLVMILMSNDQAQGYFYENYSPMIDVPAGATFVIPLDFEGNVVASPAYSVYANDVLMPDGSYYQVSCYDLNGRLVWGPNAQQVLSSPSPWDIGQWIPNEF